MVNIRDTHFVLQTRTNPHNKRIGAQELARNCVEQWKLNYSEFSNILHRAVKGEYFAKGTEKSKILGNLKNKEVENLEDHGCPKVRDLVDEEVWICSSYPFRHKTTIHCAERKANCLVTG